MKSIFYENPVISGILINLSAMFLSIYAIKYSVTPFTIMLVLVGSLNRKIIDDGTDMNNKKKILIVVSFVGMLGIILFYNKYFYNIRVIEIENK